MTVSSGSAEKVPGAGAERVLLLHTASSGPGQPGFVALADAAGVLSIERLSGRGSSEELFPALRRVLGGTGLHGLTGMGVVSGPGSFTGVRVGLAAAKGLCEACGVGLVAVSRLWLLAASAEPAGQVAAVLDAGRGEYFCGVYGSEGDPREYLLSGAEAAALVAESRQALACEAGVAERLGIALVEEPGPDLLRRLVLARMAAGVWTDVDSVDANYLRRTDAEIKAKADARAGAQG